MAYSARAPEKKPTVVRAPAATFPCRRSHISRNARHPENVTQWGQGHRFCHPFVLGSTLGGGGRETGWAAAGLDTIRQTQDTSPRREKRTDFASFGIQIRVDCNIIPVIQSKFWIFASTRKFLRLTGHLDR